MKRGREMVQAYGRGSSRGDHAVGENNLLLGLIRKDFIKIDDTFFVNKALFRV